MTDDQHPDVAALMGEVRRRVAEKKAAGLYTVDSLFDEGSNTTEPFHAEDLADIAKLAAIEPNLALARSTKPGVGQVVGKAKSGLVRATSQPLLDLADRSTSFNLALLGYVTEMAQELATLRAEVDRLRGVDDGGVG